MRLSSEATTDEVNAKMFAYKYSHHGQVSFPRLILMTGGEGPFEEDENGFGVSHFDEVLLQFNTKVRIFWYSKFIPKRKNIFRMHKMVVLIKARYRCLLI